MLLTEDEAKQRWCPFSRTAFQYRHGDGDAMVVANRAENDNPITDCIASQCMAWRWRVGPPSKQDRASYRETSAMPEWEGYCGLAGKP